MDISLFNKKFNVYWMEKYNYPIKFMMSLILMNSLNVDFR